MFFDYRCVVVVIAAFDFKTLVALISPSNDLIVAIDSSSSWNTGGRASA